MMKDLDGVHNWEEPMVGRLFGDFYRKTNASDLDRTDFIMADATREGWISSVRDFILSGAEYACPRITPEDYLVIKEPNGSVGAPIIMEALPESRMIFLVRDPRDVVASVLDGARRGSWLSERNQQDQQWNKQAVPDTNPDLFVKRRAGAYLLQMTATQQAFEAHAGIKTLVKYEDLTDSPLETMRRMCSNLGIPVEEAELQLAVSRHSWENIPKQDKGSGKFYRKGQPGSWKEDLTSDQIKIVEDITEPLISKLY